MKPIGHSHVLDRFRRCVAQGRLASTWLFAGPAGIGKLTTARYIATCLLCEGAARPVLESCGSCPSCLQMKALTHPDLIEIHRPVEDNRNLIPLELLIGDKESRMREGLCHDLALSPFRGRYRIAIINDADFLNQEGANALLKTLEEPPPRAVIFLIATNEHRQLPTIRSRAQIVRFEALQPAELRSILDKDPDWQTVSPAEVEAICLASEGSVEVAGQLRDAGVMDFRNDLFGRLVTLDPTDEDFPGTMNSFVDQAGTAASSRRDRMRLVSEMAVQLFRQAMVFRDAASMAACDSSLAHHAEALAKKLEDDRSRLADCIERCIDLRTEIAANANQALMIECWLSDLGRLLRGEFVATGSASWS